MKAQSKTALAVLALLAGTAALAQSKAPEPDYTLGFNVGAVSDYRVRGIAQTANQPSVSAGIDFAHKNGLYAGAWAASNLKWIKEFNGATKGDYEVDLWGGYKGDLGKGFGFDVGAITYQYPGNDSGDAASPGGSATFSKADTYEVYAALTYNIFTLKYNQSVGDFLGIKNSNGSRYWDLSANFDLGNGFTLTPHVGRQSIPTGLGNSAGNADYTDYALTLTKDFGNGLTASLAAVGTNADKDFYTQPTSYGGNARFLGKEAVIVGVKYTF